MYVSILCCEERMPFGSFCIFSVFKLLGNLARKGLQNQDLRHKALSQALSAPVTNWSHWTTMPTEAYKAYLFFLVDLMGMRGERDRQTQTRREHVCWGHVVCVYAYVLWKKPRSVAGNSSLGLK